MPQMAPMNWMPLYILFSIVFIIFIISTYYSFNYKPKFPSKLKNSFQLSWKL